KDAIVICSRHKPVAIGGIMGGRDTEVDASTKRLIIESANFSMYSIRKTSMEHGIFTDAVTRFGKGQSAEQCGVVLAQAVDLLRQNAGARLSNELGIEAPRRPAAVKTTVAFINERLGTELTSAQIEALLENVECVVAHHEGHLAITPPFWRTDIEIPEDIVEEVGRLHGFGNLPHSLPTRPIAAVKTPSLELLKSDIRSVLVTAGNNELQTYSFVSAKLLEKSGQDAAPAYRLRNALSPELQVVRTSLLPSLLEKVHPNHKAGYDTFGLFEIGKSHNKQDIISEPGGPDDKLPLEHLSLSYVFSAGPKSPFTQTKAPFYQAKYELTHLFAALHVREVTFEPLAKVQPESWWMQNLAALFEPKRAALARAAGQPLGIVGEFTQQLRVNFKLPAFAAGFELDIKQLHGISRPISTYQPLLKYPATEQDICLRVKTAVTYGQLETQVGSCFTHDQRLQVTITPVDIYQKPGDDAHKQITYRLKLQHHDRTLTTAEVNSLLDSVASRAHAELGAERI
ncbi:MAG TPA: phenylalanine--tRNA ligase beta subunit-related protein, partial [Candidatus Acidoferrum sp.]|nr:phenylalanine--tRNA ligase beta subunit-related protein [Candidatus Acidoferrum sp.]